MVLSWSREGEAGAQAGPAADPPVQPMEFSKSANYARVQRLSQDLTFLGVVETWRKSYSLPHREIWEDVGGKD